MTLGPHLDGGVEGDGPVLLAGGDVDLGRGDDVDVVLLDGVGQVAGDGVLQRLLAGRRQADAGLEDAAGRLAGPEAREADLAGDLAERHVDVAVELRLVHLDRQLDLVPLEGLDRALHRAASVPGDHRGPADRCVERRRGDGRTVRLGRVGRSADASPGAASGMMAPCRPGSPTAWPGPDRISSTCVRATRCRPRSTCPGCPRGTPGKVILANGFNWMRYRVRFKNGAELPDLDERHLVPTGRTARRLAKRGRSPRPDPVRAPGRRGSTGIRRDRRTTSAPRQSSHGATRRPSLDRCAAHEPRRIAERSE